MLLHCRADNVAPADTAAPSASAAAQSGPMEVAAAPDDMPLSELLSADSSWAAVTASPQTAEILQLLRRLEALNRYPTKLPCRCCLERGLRPRSSFVVGRDR